MSSGGELDGRVAIVTGSGAAGGIGAASVRALAEAGARVVLADLETSDVAAVAEEIASDGHEVAHKTVDISVEDSVKDLIAFTLERFGRLDVVDNNAASNHLVPFDTDLLDVSVHLWDEMFAVIARGTMLMCRESVRVMIGRGGGSIINVSSGKALAGDISEAAYSAAKSAVNTLTRTVATMYGKQGVRCNTVSPGVIQTTLMKAVVPETMADLFKQNILTPDLGDPSDIANLIVFLASDRSKYITGQLIPVDGGFSAHLPSVASVSRLDLDDKYLNPLEGTSRPA
ncbi:MAG: short-chain dehydrogenase/reductase [Acidimicrobiales bacterium]|nr:short-chain dehydrogenase/reductase [Acidimicrobiales bacterium]